MKYIVDVDGLCSEVRETVNTVLHCDACCNGAHTSKADAMLCLINYLEGQENSFREEAQRVRKELKDTPKPTCGNRISLDITRTVICDRPEWHEVVGFNEGPPYSLHRGGGYFWDNRCAWPEGQEPTS